MSNQQVKAEKNPGFQAGQVLKDNTSDAAHTLTPWRLNSITIEDRRSILAHDPEFGDVRVADIPDCVDGESEANATFIVRAVNSHDALISALQGLFEHCAMVHKHWGDGSNQKEADAAITAARATLAEVQS